MTTFTSFTVKCKENIGYQYLKAILKDDEIFAPSDCDDNAFTIEIEEVYDMGVDETLELAISFNTRLENFIKKNAPQMKTPVFKFEGVTSYDGAEEEAFRIENTDGKITIEETQNYVHYGSGYFSDYDEFCLECGEIMEEDEFDSDFEINVCNNVAYVYEYPPYGKKVDVQHYRLHNVITSADEDIVNYFEENGIPYNEQKLNNLSLIDVMNIMNGTYQE